MTQLVAYRVTRKHFGPERPGAQHRIHAPGATIYAPADGAGSLPPKQDYAEAIDAPKAKAAPAAVKAAQDRLKAARAELKKADKAGVADDTVKAQAEVEAAEAAVATAEAEAAEA